MEFKIENIISALSIPSLNPMQERVMQVPAQSDLRLLSPTGSGKTLAYLLASLPFVERGGQHPRVIVISPTRELAQQSESVFSRMKSGAKSLCCYGGHQLSIERRSLLAGCDVVFATPGRLLDHLDSTYIDGRGVVAVVIDEFDKLVEMGFSEEVATIMDLTPNCQKRILTSATDSQVPSYVGLRENHTTINMLDEKRPDITVRRIITTGNDLEHTAWLLSQLEGRSTVIFCNFREDVEMVADYLSDHDIVCDYFHGGMEQRDRERVIAKFRNGSTDILISTDIAARGIDVLSVDNIIHFHTPQKIDSLIHRNGRTARVGAKGAAYIIDSRENELLDSIEVMEISPVDIKVSKPNFATIYIGKGKKDKINKVDIVGFLCTEGAIQKSDIGLIEVKDFYAYVAVKRELSKELVNTIKSLKIKKQRCKIELCK